MRGNEAKPELPLAAGKKLLVTGASGVVGQGLLERLPADRVICLVRRTDVRFDGAEMVRGDICQPRLGLGESDYRALTGRVGGVVHSAATTSFTDSMERTFAINVEGTRHALALAQAADAPFHYISTAFVPPARAEAAPGSATPYELSKQAAEQLVRDAGHPYTITRPSIVVGDSATGAMSKVQGFHQILKMLLKNRLPFLGAPEPNFIDFVPVDVVARSIVTLISDPDASGEYWLTSGQKAPDLRRLIDLAISEIAARLGHVVRRPRFVSPGQFERLVRPGLGSVILRAAYRQLDSFTRYLRTEPISSLYPGQTATGGGIPFDPENVYVKNVLYFARLKGLGVAPDLPRSA